MTNDKGILIKNIYYMLSYAFQVLTPKDYAEIQFEKFDAVHDLFAVILSKGVARQIKQGLYREYISFNDSLAVMRGKIDINGTVRQKMQRKRQFICDYDELSENNIYNQILKCTITCLIKAEDADTENTGNVSGLILYAKTSEEIFPDYDFEMGGNRISAKSLDLNQNFQNIARQLDDIVRLF